jgi:hypothetical protein
MTYRLGWKLNLPPEIVRQEIQGQTNKNLDKSVFLLSVNGLDNGNRPAEAVLPSMI